MNRFINNDPLVPLIAEYQRMMKEANLLAVVNKKLARQRFNHAQIVALQIVAFRFRN